MSEGHLHDFRRRINEKVLLIFCTNWDQACTRRHHMTAKGVESASFGVPNERRAIWLRSFLSHFGRTASDLLSEQTRSSILRWNPGPKRGFVGAKENHIAGRRHTVALQE